MTEEGSAQRLAELARIERDTRRWAQRARTDLAEATCDMLAGGMTLDGVSRLVQLTGEDLADLLAHERSRVHQRRYLRDRYRMIKAGEIEPLHGTSEGLAAGCHCEQCEAKRARDYQHRRRERASGLPAGDPRHGTRQGYVRYGCHCGDCQAVTAAYGRARRSLSTEEHRRSERERKRRRRTQMSPEELEEQRRKERERWRHRASEKARRTSPPTPGWVPVVDAAPPQWRKLRQQAAVTMTAIAQHLGVDVAQVSRWECGKTSPRAEARNRYIAALNQLAATVRRKEE
jgi:hypothetical protein